MKTDMKYERIGNCADLFPWEEEDEMYIEIKNPSDESSQSITGLQLFSPFMVSNGTSSITITTYTAAGAKVETTYSNIYIKSHSSISYNYLVQNLFSDVYYLYDGYAEATNASELVKNYTVQFVDADGRNSDIPKLVKLDVNQPQTNVVKFDMRELDFFINTRAFLKFDIELTAGASLKFCFKYRVLRLTKFNEYMKLFNQGEFVPLNYDKYGPDLMNGPVPDQYKIAANCNT